MKNHTLFGIAAIIAALGYTFRPFTNAHANIGPSVSTGSNPIFTEFGSYTTTSSWTTIDAVTSPSAQDAVIVRVRVDCNAGTYKRFTTSQGATLFSHDSQQNSEISYDRLGFVIPAGESLQLMHRKVGSSVETCTWIAMGYYMHQ